jgi:hypothetical protein
MRGRAGYVPPPVDSCPYVGHVRDRGPVRQPVTSRARMDSCPREAAWRDNSSCRINASSASETTSKGETLQRTHYLSDENVHYKWDAENEPLVVIESGDTVVVETRDISDRQVGPDSDTSALGLGLDRSHRRIWSARQGALAGVCAHLRSVERRLRIPARGHRSSAGPLLRHHGRLPGRGERRHPCPSLRPAIKACWPASGAGCTTPPGLG